ncbi:sugar-phosphatase [Saccharopolyspora erythraea NRRL 2338]|uniref:HAD-IA family hydrolase n=1 Tax=Saccharopolyspora erythraea TaxID=1836 RepID=UPI000304E828|nr:HAD-IA family hydrolase [Saccharopolyspora erythraea]PFG94942.1 sugar-phosphatase [Saccharopolyspora erythraea NRRL 2338]
MQNKRTGELRVRAVLLDLDGTLVDSHAAVRRSWQRWADAVGIPLESFFHRTHGRPGHEVMAEVLPERPLAENLADNRALLADEIEDTDGVRALPGAARLLASLAEMPWAIVTACTEPLARARLAAAGLATPEVLVTSEQTDAGKPDPAGYLLAARRLGVEPAWCAVVEDASAGVRAAIAAGMHVIGVGGPVEPAPTWELAGLDDLEVLPDGVLLRLVGSRVHRDGAPIST